MQRTTIAIAALLIVLTNGCSNLSRFEGAGSQPVKLWIREQPVVTLPADVKLASTSFGQYLFEAKSGDQVLYGLLPLRFRGDYLALDILFFAPAMFFNLRTTFDYYEFDVPAGVIRYRNDSADAWTSYKPTGAEIAHARSYFDSRQPSTPEGN